MTSLHFRALLCAAALQLNAAPVAANAPPFPPSGPSPADGALYQPVNVPMTWSATDPDGDALIYDVYFGTAPNPTSVTYGFKTPVFSHSTLQVSTIYYWRVVARDPSGNRTSGPEWHFTTLDNSPPTVPINPFPNHLATSVSLWPTLHWYCSDPDLQALKYDVYLGATSPPPRIAANVARADYAPPGTLLLSTTYHWRIVARDPIGATTSGPEWSFTTHANLPPAAPSILQPLTNGYSTRSPVLAWQCSDPDLQPLAYDIFLGTVSPPPLLASGWPQTTFATTTLDANTRYYWRVVASDGALTTSSPEWSFTVAEPGEVNGDGQITTADASCAIDWYLLYWSCGGERGRVAADVDCSSTVTPRDARCVHRRAVGQACSFCGDDVTVAASLSTPRLNLESQWERNDTLYCRLALSGLATMEAFGFDVQSELPFVSAQRRAVPFDVLRSNTYHVVYPPTRVAGYSLASIPLTGSTSFVELRFLKSGDDYTVRIESFVDDLSGAPAIEFYLGGGVPVLVRSFEAVARKNGVALAWSLESDESLESYTIYRRTGEAPAVLLVAGSAGATSGTYFDSSVVAGLSYEYQLVVRATAGGEFRSPPRRVTLTPLSLELGVNHPNPFNPRTTIPYTVPARSVPVRVRLAIYDTSGRLVRSLVDEVQAGGSREAVWRGDDSNGTVVTSGVYFCVLQVEGKRLTRKLVLLK